MKKQKIETLDSTLRDGQQGEGISYSLQDKIRIARALDELEIDFIEAGNPGSNPKDMEFFQEMKKNPLAKSKLCAFGSTRRKGIKASEDANIQSLIAAGTDNVVIFGKSSIFHVKEILQTTPEENLAMIRESCQFLTQNNINVLYDAEHFFTGYKENPEYALKTLEAAKQGGAKTITLCDTNGGALLDDCKKAVEAATKTLGKDCTVGIHTHNDSGLAVANTLVAVEAGARHVQGVLLGFGERTGNANLSTIISNLQLKMGYDCIPDEVLKNLTPICKRVASITNIPLNPALPYIGANAFAHKAGMHIDAVLKKPSAYEHADPESVGNSRVFLMSEVAGRSMVIKEIQKFMPSVKKNDELVKTLIDKMKKLEFDGYQFEGAEGSFELLTRKTIGKYQPFFKLHYYQTSGINPRPESGVNAMAQIKVEVNGQIAVTAGEGDGPVNALDIALHNALSRFYPALDTIRLIDYKVRVIDGKDGTAAKVRVLIETSDGVDTWTTVGVSPDIIEASWTALVDSFEYKLIKDIEKHFGKLI